LPKKVFFLQGLLVAGAGGLGLQVGEGLAEEARAAGRTVVNGIADPRVHHLHNGPDQGARRVVLAAVAPGVAHALDLAFVEGAQLVLLFAGLEVEAVHVLQDLAQVVAALDLVVELAEDLADLVFDGVRAGGFLLEAAQPGEELMVHELHQVGPGVCLLVVRSDQLTGRVRFLRAGPIRPAEGLLQDGHIALALQLGLHAAHFLQVVEVFEEEDPAGLLGVVQLVAAAAFLPEDVVDVAEGLFEGGGSGLLAVGGERRYAGVCFCRAGAHSCRAGARRTVVVFYRAGARRNELDAAAAATAGFDGAFGEQFGLKAFVGGPVHMQQVAGLAIP
jgi:hypothetical protein